MPSYHCAQKGNTKKSTHNGRMDGGRLLGKGVYGCAFTPTLYCAGQKYVKEGKVGKISQISDDVKNEIKIATSIRTIEHYSNYYIVAEEACQVAPKAQQKDPDRDKCDMWKEKGHASWVQLTMPLGGRPLYATPINAQHIQLWRLGNHLLEAATLLLIKGIVHYDLHMNNILVDSPTKARIIDFGLSWNINSLTSDFTSSLVRKWDPSFIHQVPEQALMNGILDSRIRKGNPNIPHIVTQIIKQNKIFEMIEKYLHITRSQSYNVLTQFVESSNAVKKEDYTAMFRYYWNKIDSWAIGCALLICYSQLIMDSSYAKSEEYSVHNNVMVNTMRKMLNPDPAMRYDAAQALSSWNPSSPVLQQKEVKAWLSRVQ